MHSVKLIAQKAHLPGADWNWIVRRMEKVITMTGQPSRDTARLGALRDRRYTIRYPFAADAEMIDMESGKQLTGVTSDISLGGCFICTSKPFPLNTRGRLQLTRRGQVLDAMVIVRIVKPRIGVGVEFFDLEPPNDRVLSEWIETLRKNR